MRNDITFSFINQNFPDINLIFSNHETDLPLSFYIESIENSYFFGSNYNKFSKQSFLERKIEYLETIKNDF